MLETDISYFYKTFYRHIINATLILNFSDKVAFFKTISDGLLSVLNNELLCQKHLFSWYAGLLCLSLGFSDLSVIGAITGYCEKCVAITYAPS